MITRRAIRKHIILLQEFISYNQSQIKYLITNAGFSEEHPEIIEAYRSIEHFRKRIRECQTNLEILSEMGRLG